MVDNKEINMPYTHESIFRGSSIPIVEKHKQEVKEETIEDGFGSKWSAYCPGCGYLRRKGQTRLDSAIIVDRHSDELKKALGKNGESG